MVTRGMFLKLLLVLAPSLSSAGVFGGLPTRFQLPRLHARDQQPSFEMSAAAAAAPQGGGGGGGSKNENAAAQLAAKMDSHPGLALQLEARRQAEAQMKVSIAIEGSGGVALRRGSTGCHCPG
jgi:hypothetical protein